MNSILIISGSSRLSPVALDNLRSITFNRTVMSFHFDAFGSSGLLQQNGRRVEIFLHSCQGTVDP